MGLFRPARTATGPDGHWEIYVSKTALPAWIEGRGGDDALSNDEPIGLLSLPFMIVGVLWAVLVRPLLRFTVLLPFAVVRGRRSSAVRIEAVNAFPEREVLLWTTTDGQVEGVLDEIVAGLSQGKVVQPAGAVYSGRERG